MGLMNLDRKRPVRDRPLRKKGLGPSTDTRGRRDSCGPRDDVARADSGGGAAAWGWSGTQVAVLDEVYVQYAVAALVIQECKRRAWWPYVQGGVIDIAGRQHHAAPSQVEIWRRLARLRLRSHRVPLRDGMERLRTFLRDPASGEPRITISPRCQALIREFGLYRYHEPSEHRPISEAPIDADNHAIKALCYWLFDRFGAVYRRPRRPRPFRMLA